ncbi:Fic family protein [uncultured Megasphaera sp.]|uniref:Fic family protein n=1 Tax=uncultured Megasphaera sp. TaxID=165188 RepID=UPI00265D0E87|nr:Fic family protein [uncultured Megasphaera sp.]
MKYMSAKEAAAVWNLSERSIQEYCMQGRIGGAVLHRNTWNIPAASQKPVKNSKETAPSLLLGILRREKESQFMGGIYHRLQIDMTYHSNRIAENRLTHEQTQYLFETKQIYIADRAVRVDDIVEAVNHFNCIDLVIEQASSGVSEQFIKELHRALKIGTTDAYKDWFFVGNYKSFSNISSPLPSSSPEYVSQKMKELLDTYRTASPKRLEDILEFYVRFEAIKPFQSGNGRVGRLLMLSECLRNGIVPFILFKDMKPSYHHGLSIWHQERSVLRDICREAQHHFQSIMEHFSIV